MNRVAFWLSIMFLMGCGSVIESREPCRSTACPLKKTFVVKGTPANIDHWPSTFIFQPGELAAPICTATLIGLEVALLAEHCLLSGSRLGQIGKTLTEEGNIKDGTPVECFAYEPSEGQPYLDIAICDLLDETPILASQYAIELLNTNPSTMKKDDELTLVGYGCTLTANCDLREEGTPEYYDCLRKEIVNDEGKLNYGEAKLVGVNKSNHKLKLTVDESYACPGDSGGAAYSYVPSVRAVAGVISGSYRQLKMSEIVDVSDSDFIAWVSQWVATGTSVGKNRSICGLTPRALGCRVANPPNPKGGQEYKYKQAGAPSLNAGSTPRLMQN